MPKTKDIHYCDSCAGECDRLLALEVQNKILRHLARQCAYPRRGTKEENQDIYDLAALIQQHFTLEQLENEP